MGTRMRGGQLAGLLERPRCAGISRKPFRDVVPGRGASSVMQMSSRKEIHSVECTELRLHNCDIS